MSRGLPWTPEEERTFSEVFPHCGAEGVHELLPHRSVLGINARASLYKVRRLPRHERKALADLRPSSPPPAPVGCPAAFHPEKQRVPEAAIGLPWVSVPRDPQDTHACAEALEAMVHGEKRPAVRKYLETQALNLRALAKRMEALQPAAV